MSILQTFSMQHFLAVSSLCVYYGENEWDGSFSLKDMLEIPEKIKPLVSDYKVTAADKPCTGIRTEGRTGKHVQCIGRIETGRKAGGNRRRDCLFFLVVPFDDRFLFPCDYFRWSNLPGGGLFAVSLVRFQCPRKKESFILKYFFYFTVMFFCVGIIINSYQQKPSPIMKF